MSYVYSGLSGLATERKIRLESIYPWSRNRPKPGRGDVTLWLEVRDSPNALTRQVCFDLHDKSNRFIQPRLEKCDVYYKRSYYLPHIEELPAHLRKKVRPFGLNYPCQSRHDRLILRAGGYYISNYFDLHRPMRSIKQAYYTAYLFKQYKQSPFVDEFESSPENPLNPTILFQTRVWGPTESDDNWLEVNEGRVSVIRALKAAFGNQFVGGLIPTEVARQYYPDCLSSYTSERKQFIEMSKRSLIGIYTRGLHHSLAWKLPEYLAASKCIVSEPLRNQLPVPLEPNKHYLEFSTPEECIVACRRLLSDPQLTSHMRQANYSYYMAQVRPSAHILNCLERALNEPA
jgi:hypothetical protein